MMSSPRRSPSAKKGFGVADKDLTRDQKLRYKVGKKDFNKLISNINKGIDAYTYFFKLFNKQPKTGSLEIVDGSGSVLGVIDKQTLKSFKAGLNYSIEELKRYHKFSLQRLQDPNREGSTSDPSNFKGMMYSRYIITGNLHNFLLDPATDLGLVNVGGADIRLIDALPGVSQGIANGITVSNLMRQWKDINRDQLQDINRSKQINLGSAAGTQLLRFFGSGTKSLFQENSLRKKVRNTNGYGAIEQALLNTEYRAKVDGDWYPDTLLTKIIYFEMERTGPVQEVSDETILSDYQSVNTIRREMFNDKDPERKAKSREYARRRAAAKRASQ